MSRLLDQLERRARSVTGREEASLARVLTDELDPTIGVGVEQFWIEEAQRRYEGYLKGEVEALPGDAVMHGARSRLAMTRPC